MSESSLISKNKNVSLHSQPRISLSEASYLKYLASDSETRILYELNLVKSGTYPLRGGRPLDAAEGESPSKLATSYNKCNFKDEYVSSCLNPIGTVYDENGNNFPLSCGKWSCSHCGWIKKQRLLDRVTFGFSGGFRIRHFVLTELKASGSKHEDISRHWARLRASLAKLGYVGYRFFWTKEFKDGFRHMHLMISTYIPKHVIERLWYLATDKTAYIIRQKDHDVHSPAGYLSKYLTKDFREAPFKKHERRYGLSQGHFPIVKKDISKHVYTVILGSFKDEVLGPDDYGVVIRYGDSCPIWYDKSEYEPKHDDFMKVYL
jgi:Zn-finger protein